MVSIAPLPRLKPLTTDICGHISETLNGPAYRTAPDGILTLIINGTSVGRVEASEIAVQLGELIIPLLDGQERSFPLHRIKLFAQNGSFAFGGNFDGQSLVVELR
jgi:hypothetical protein